MEKRITEQDCKKLQILMSRILKEASFNLKINDFVDLFNDLDWVSKTLLPKMQANIFEVVAVKTPEEQKAKPKTTKAKK